MIRVRWVLEISRRFATRVLCLTLPALAIAFLILEGVLRLIIPACEVPSSFFDREHRMIRYDARGRTQGVFTAGAFAQQRARWRINKHGWNSDVDYFGREARTKPLIAVIGDSYAEAFQTDVDRSLAAFLRELLGHEYDVYSFGFSGASLSHYLHMSRYVRAIFAPDIYVFLAVHNDFAESLRHLHYKPHLLQLRVGRHGMEEVLPEAPRISRVRRLLGKSALVRYLVFNLRLRESIQQLLPARAKDRFEANIDVTEVAFANQLVEQSTEYVVRQIKAESGDAEIVFLLDGMRESIYSGQPPKAALVRLHDILRDATARNGCHFVDLHPGFAERHAADGTRFNTEYDFHWDEVGQEVAARIVHAYLVETGLTSPRTHAHPEHASAASSPLEAVHGQPVSCHQQAE